MNPSCIEPSGQRVRVLQVQVLHPEPHTAWYTTLFVDGVELGTFAGEPLRGEPDLTALDTSIALGTELGGGAPFEDPCTIVFDDVWAAPDE